jgi:hypothetical protein
MTLTFMRPALALTLALSLASCGGKATFPVSGTIIGLNYDGLVLSTNGMDLPVPKNATSFTFPNALSYGEVYNVIPKAQPAHQTCSFATVFGNSPVIYNGPSDTAGRFGAINIGVACSTNTIALGGKITGLTSPGLQLVNGSDAVPIAPVATDVTFTFPAVSFGSTYGITVLKQPDNDVCTVANGTGTMSTDEAPVGIEVNCVKKT